jgi:hypothetical protein
MQGREKPFRGLGIRELKKKPGTAIEDRRQIVPPQQAEKPRNKPSGRISIELSQA